jgi:acetyltransferase-like isoleucine patch superfamily enzyme
MGLRANRPELVERVARAISWRAGRLRKNLFIAGANAAHAARGIEAVCDVLHGTSDSEVIARLLTRYGAQVGEGTYFKGYLTIDNANRDEDSTNDFRHLSFGRRVFVGKNVSLDLPARIVLEDETILSAGVSILTHADCGTRHMGRYFPRKTGDVVIGFGSWIGANATILCGVTVGRSAVVGASSLVTRNVPEGEIWAGVPARRIGFVGT